MRVDGSYTAGPCENGGTPVTGRVTDGELLRLSTLVEPIATSDLANTRECELFGAIASRSYDLTLPNGTTWRFLEMTPDAICTRGGRAQAAALADYMHTLTEKYYPRRPAQ